MIELGITRWSESLRYCSSLEAIMHNLISFNQLAGSKHPEDTFDPHNDLITEYYECLIDCEHDQHVCKRICKEVLI